MGTILAGTNFPTELVATMFNAVAGHSSLAKLCASTPIPFQGQTVMVFTNAGEASLVAEGAAKPAGDADVSPVVIRPQKFVYQQRISDEFVKNSESRLNYLQAFAEGFGRVIARGLDIAAIHGIDPATKADIAGLATNNFDDLLTGGAIITYDSTNPDTNIQDAVNAIQGNDAQVTGIAMCPTFASDLGALKVNGVPQFPEFRFGQNPAAFSGLASDVNSTVDYTGAAVGAPTDYALVGDFANAFKWGYANNIPLEVIEYGDPDGAGHDLKQYNEVLLRAEAYIGWGILNPAAFAVVR